MHFTRWGCTRPRPGRARSPLTSLLADDLTGDSPGIAGFSGLVAASPTFCVADSGEDMRRFARSVLDDRRHEQERPQNHQHSHEPYHSRLLGPRLTAVTIRL